MSTQPTYDRVVEWSPSGVTAYDTATRRLTTADSLASLASTFGGGSILVAVSRRSTFVKAVRVPNAASSEINLILQTQMASMFPVPLSELAYSFRLTDDVTPEGRLAVVAAMREVDLKTLLAAGKDAGFKIDKVLPAAFGSVLLADSLGQKDAAVVQKTPEGLAIDVLAGGELRYSRVAPMPTSPVLIEAEVSRTFAAVALPCAPTIAAGGIDYADAETLSAVPTLEALATMPVDRLEINIEPREVIEKREKASQAKRTRLAVLLCAAALLLASLVYLDRADAAELTRRGNAKWLNTLSKLRQDRKRFETNLTTTKKVSESIARAFQPAQRLSDVLTTVGNHVPKGLWLTGVTLERGKTMFIRGTATNSAAVADFLQALTAEPRLRDVKLVFANNGEIDKTAVVQFSIQAFPVGNLPLVDAKKKGARK